MNPWIEHHLIKATEFCCEISKSVGNSSRNSSPNRQEKMIVIDQVADSPKVDVFPLILEDAELLDKKNSIGDPTNNQSSSVHIAETPELTDADVDALTVLHAYMYTYKDSLVPLAKTFRL